MYSLFENNSIILPYIDIILNKKATLILRLLIIREKIKGVVHSPFLLLLIK
ncbi:hypothetical protein T190115A13A_130069 [Tenacibaculum sp. 190524A02b]|uniref:Uncharacterized protein n=1 Tax=Tenacibaculum vairaonense TaxID=3137860 RepID=A0ABM9PHV6_9FLAO